MIQLTSSQSTHGPEITDENNEKATKERSTLSNDEISRYSRQLILPEIGIKGK